MSTIPSLKITIIDDDASMRTMLEDFIRQKYPLVVLATYETGEDALQQISGEENLIVLDYNLDSIQQGGMNGVEVFRKLKERFPAIPVIFISGQEKSEVAANTFKLGAQDYIIKNENIFKRLDTTLNQILGKATNAKMASKQRLRLAVVLILAFSLLITLLVWNNR